MMFWENYIKECAKKNKTPTAVAKENGITSGTVTGWRKGAMPRHTVLYKLADYFGVTVDYLLGNETKKEPAPERDKLLQEAIDIMSQLSDDDRRQAHKYLVFLKENEDKK